MTTSSPPPGDARAGFIVVRECPECWISGTVPEVTSGTHRGFCLSERHYCPG